MAIRFVNRAVKRGVLNWPLQDAVMSLQGTHVAPINRTGILVPQLGDAVWLLQGLVSHSPNRTGQIATTLDSAAFLFQGSYTPAGGGPAVAFSWTPPAQTAGVTGYEVGIRPSNGTVGVYPILLPVEGPFTSADLLANIEPPLTSGSYFAAVRAVGPTNNPWTAETAFTV